MRVYGNEDVVGVEVGGAVKNVLAIATGLCDGLQLGLNARAALITRGLAEITRLGVALGAQLAWLGRAAYLPSLAQAVYLACLENGMTFGTLEGGGGTTCSRGTPRRTSTT